VNWDRHVEWSGSEWPKRTVTCELVVDGREGDLWLTRLVFAGE
jgi:hypothetical protein